MTKIKKQLTFKCYAKPNKTARDNHKSLLRISKIVYNWALRKSFKHKERIGKYLTKYDLQKELTLLKKRYHFLNDIDVLILRGSVARVAKATSRHQTKKGGKPRYKTRYRTLEIDEALPSNIKEINGKWYVRAKGLGKIRFKPSQKITGKPTTIKITRTINGKYYVCVSTKEEIEVKPKKGIGVGIDIGVRKFVIISDGVFYKKDNYYKEIEDRLSRLDNGLSTKKSGSRKHKRLSNSREKLLRKYSNRSKNYDHHLSKKLVNDYATMFVEDFKMSKIAIKSKAKKKNRDLYAMSPKRFLTYLDYKAANAGNRVQSINPKDTSRTCSECQHVNDGTDSEWFVCIECGYEYDRDFNASYNMLYKGFTMDDGICYRKGISNG